MRSQDLDDENASSVSTRASTQFDHLSVLAQFETYLSTTIKSFSRQIKEKKEEEEKSMLSCWLFTL